ncbi:MAG: BON domain-containing protein [Pseudomonadota bacterium]
MQKLPFAMTVMLCLSGGVIGSAYAETTYSTDSKRVSDSVDNTDRNERDANDKTMLPTDQSNQENDLNVTTQIRQSIVEDDSLSTNAHNIKIITTNGTVTLRGPVDSETERERILATAKKFSKNYEIVDQLEINS